MTQIDDNTDYEVQCFDYQTEKYTRDYETMMYLDKSLMSQNDQYQIVTPLAQSMTCFSAFYELVD